PTLLYLFSQQASCVLSILFFSSFFLFSHLFSSLCFVLIACWTIPTLPLPLSLSLSHCVPLCVSLSRTLSLSLSLSLALPPLLPPPPPLPPSLSPPPPPSLSECA